MRGDFLAATPPRLRAGAAILLILASASVLGLVIASDPIEITDPSGAALLPPASRRWEIALVDGSSLAVEAARLEGDHWVVLRRGTPQNIPASQVLSVRHRTFWLGTDTLGRDVLARVLAGGRVSLALGTLALLVALILGVGIGLVSGWRGGLADTLLMRLVDSLLAVPILFLLLLLAAIFRPSLTTLVIVLGFTSWMGVARLVRAQVLSLKEREFILAARAIGASPLRIALRHLLPNTLTPVAQDAALRLGDLILAEAALSFLGLGVQPPMPSWGNMVAEAEGILLPAWWLTMVPGLAVAATVIGAALLADGLRQLSRAESGAPG